MLAPLRTRSQSTTPSLSPRSPSEFELILAAARLEALALLQSLLHAPITSAAEARERRLAATAILRIPEPDAREAPAAAVESKSAPPNPVRPPTTQSSATDPRAQPPVRQATVAMPPAAPPISPRPARPQIARVLAAAGADSS